MTTTASPARAVTARAAGLELEVSAAGTVLRVVLRNRAERALTIAAAVEAHDGRHHDYLRAELTGAATRTLRFTGDRNASTTGIIELAPGAETGDDLDLTQWATRPINGGAPLASGDYTVHVVYEVKQPGIWNGSITAGPVTMHVP